MWALLYWHRASRGACAVSAGFSGFPRVSAGFGGFWWGLAAFRALALVDAPLIAEQVAGGAVAAMVHVVRVPQFAELRAAFAPSVAKLSISASREGRAVFVARRVGRYRAAERGAAALELRLERRLFSFVL